MRLAATTGSMPAERNSGIAIWETMMTGPAPLMAVKMIAIAAVRARAMAVGLSPASSAALRMIASEMPSFWMAFAKMAPKIVTEIVLASFTAPFERTKSVIDWVSASADTNGTPATAAIRMPIKGSARIAGSFFVIIRTTPATKTAKIRMTCNVAMLAPFCLGSAAPLQQNRASAWAGC